MIYYDTFQYWFEYFVMKLALKILHLNVSFLHELFWYAFHSLFEYFVCKLTLKIPHLNVSFLHELLWYVFQSFFKYLVVKALKYCIWIYFSSSIVLIYNLCYKIGMKNTVLECNLVNPIIIVVYRSAGPDKSADFVMKGW